MPNEEDRMSFDVWCDLLERELKIALEDLEKIRKSNLASLFAIKVTYFVPPLFTVGPWKDL